MAWIQINSYFLRYNKDRTMAVGIKYREGGTPSGKLLTHTVSLSGSDATFLADLLRYEKPVYFDPNTGAISTSDEPLGEEE
jgi:hypothetical protein